MKVINRINNNFFNEVRERLFSLLKEKGKFPLLCFLDEVGNQAEKNKVLSVLHYLQAEKEIVLDGEFISSGKKE